MHATSYILTYRESNDPARRWNLEAVLDWLKLQVAEVIVVEQDAAPTLDELPRFPGLRVLFAYNPGPFNKSWGFNVGARYARGSLLAFGDADLISRALPAAISAARTGVPVVRAFRAVRDLDEEASDMLRADLSCLSDPSFPPAEIDRRAQGENPPLCGGLVIFQPAFFALLGGWDERFLGWGGEDDAMSVKVARAQIACHVVPDTDAFHLHHRRANADVGDDAGYRGNLALLEQIRTMPDEALKRLCEISWQLAGYQDRHRPLDVRA